MNVIIRSTVMPRPRPVALSNFKCVKIYNTNYIISDHKRLCLQTFACARSSVSITSITEKGWTDLAEILHAGISFLTKEELINHCDPPYTFP